MDPRRAYLSSDGPVCDRCQRKEEVNEEFAGAATYYGTSSIGFAVASLLFNPLGLLTIASIVVGIQGLRKLTQGALAEDYARALGPERQRHVQRCRWGIALALLVFAFRVLLVPQ